MTYPKANSPSKLLYMPLEDYEGCRLRCVECHELFDVGKEGSRYHHTPPVFMSGMVQRIDTMVPVCSTQCSDGRQVREALLSPGPTSPPKPLRYPWQDKY